MYGDPETRSFYEDLPDLLSLVPLSVLGFTPEQAAAMRAEWSNKTTESEDEQVIDDKLGDDAIAEAAEGGMFSSNCLSLGLVISKPLNSALYQMPSLKMTTRK